MIEEIAVIWRLAISNREVEKREFLKLGNSMASRHTSMVQKT